MTDLSPQIHEPAPISEVAIYGHGLALWLTALVLDRSLPDDIRIQIIETSGPSVEDLFHGFLMPPETFAFHLSLGVSEPELVQSLDMGFSYGTAFRNWGQDSHSWVQAFHAPLPIVGGVPLAKVVTSHSATADLQACLISALATAKGVFAHPPEDRANPLSRAEYGYLVDPRELAGFYRSLCGSRLRIVKGSIDRTAKEGTSLRTITLSTGDVISADLWVDASGAQSALVGPADVKGPTQYATLAQGPSNGLGLPAALVEGDGAAWSSAVQLSKTAMKLGASDTQNSGSMAFTDSFRSDPWQGNVVAIGRAAARTPPLTVAPMRLLIKDVCRLRDLFPVQSRMSIEAREYNTAFRDDLTHAFIFHAAHFIRLGPDRNQQWEQAGLSWLPDSVRRKLGRKLDLHGSRGYGVSYDHEVFDLDSWAILMDGLGHRPKRRDRLALSLSTEEASAYLNQLKLEARAVISKMPPHNVYMTRMRDYLVRRGRVRA